MHGKLSPVKRAAISLEVENSPEMGKNKTKREKGQKELSIKGPSNDVTKGVPIHARVSSLCNGG